MNYLTERGKIAIDQVKSKTSRDSDLWDLMGGQCDVSSCNATVSILCDVITRGQSGNSKYNAFSPDTPQVQRVKFIADKLKEPNLIYIAISPDHHFVVFPIDAGQIIVLQGFQETYTLLEWMDATNQGTYSKARFIEQLGELVREDGVSKVRAALNLFSFNISGTIQRDNRPTRKHVGKQIVDYFKNSPTRIKSVMWWPI